MRSDLRFLADDQMGGRDTPSQELRIAALYLAARLERLGFEAAGDDGFFHHWLLARVGLDPEASGITVRSAAGEARLALGRDYFLARMSHGSPHVVEGGLVSVGAGTEKEFAAAELEGSWALLDDQGASARRLQRYAERTGAVGLLLCESPAGADYATKYGPTAETITRERYDYAPDGPARALRDEIPYVLLPRAAWSALLAEARLDQNGTPPAGTRLPLRLREDRVARAGEARVANVAGFWPGRDTVLAREVLIVSAHYDHVGRKGEDVFNGADDNASGSAGLLALADALVAYGPLRRSVLLLWLCGEEKGLWGSEAWTRDPQLPEGCVAVADLNLDMIGRTRPDELYLTPTETHSSFNGLSRAAYALSPLEGFPVLRSQDEDWARSDHFNFDKNLGIPVAFLSAGEHPDYHKPTDTAEKIDFEKVVRVVRLVLRMLDRIEDGPLR